MCYDKHQKELEKVTIKRGNLLEIKTIQSSYRTPKTGSLNNKCIVYTANALRQICGNFNMNTGLKYYLSVPFIKLENSDLTISPSKTIGRTQPQPRGIKSQKHSKN